MALPTIIGYLLSRNRGDGSLVVVSADQTIVPAVPPGVEFTIQQLPGEGNYAAILYQAIGHPDMIPDAFWARSQFGGSQAVVGVLTAHWIGYAQDTYTVISRKTPARSIHTRHQKRRTSR